MVDDIYIIMQMSYAEWCKQIGRHKLVSWCARSLTVCVLSVLIIFPRIHITGLSPTALTAFKCIAFAGQRKCDKYYSFAGFHLITCF